jgi:hypothetical protein
MSEESKLGAKDASDVNPIIRSQMIKDAPFDDVRNCQILTLRICSVVLSWAADPSALNARVVSNVYFPRRMLEAQELTRYDRYDIVIVNDTSERYLR